MAKKATPKKSKGAEPQDGIRLSAHPRAQRDIAMAKGYGGLAAFVVVLVLSLRAGLPTSDAILRGLMGGVVGYVLAWGVAVTVWRHLALAELERLRQRTLYAMQLQAAQEIQAEDQLSSADTGSRA